MATLQSGKCFTVPTFFGMCCRSEWQERMYIYKWHEVDQTKHEIFCVHIVCNEIQVKVNLEITTFFFYLRFPYCPNFFWFGVVYIYNISCLNQKKNTYQWSSKRVWWTSSAAKRLAAGQPEGRCYIRQRFCFFCKWQATVEIQKEYLFIIQVKSTFCYYAYYFCVQQTESHIVEA